MDGDGNAMGIDAAADASMVADVDAVVEVDAATDVVELDMSAENVNAAVDAMSCSVVDGTPICVDFRRTCMPSRVSRHR